MPELTLNPQQKQELIGTLSDELAKEAQNINSTTTKLVNVVRVINVPEGCEDKAMAFKTKLKNYANDLRLFCQKSIGSLNAQKFVERNKFNMWIKLVEASLKTMKKQYAEFSQRTSDILEACADLQNEIQQVKKAAEAAKNSWKSTKRWMIGLALLAGVVALGLAGAAFLAVTATSCVVTSIAAAGFGVASTLCLGYAFTKCVNKAEEARQQEEIRQKSVKYMGELSDALEEVQEGI